MADPATPLAAELVWARDLKFGATSGSTAIVIDGDGSDGPSPMQMLGEAIAGCMAIDVVMILQKGRHPVEGLRVSFTGHRAPEPPRRYTDMLLTFHVTGNVPTTAIERAIDLSRQTYCSVFHSLRQDITLTTSYEVHA